MQNTCTERCQIQHFIISDLTEFLRILDDPRIGGVNAVYIRIDLAGVRMERRGDRDSCRIGAAASEGRQVVIPVDALEARDQNDPSCFEFMLDPVGIDPLEAGISVNTRGVHHDLERIQRNCWNTHFGERHRHQRDGDLLSRSHQHIEFPLRRVFRNFMCFRDQFVCRFPHCGKHDDHIMSGTVILCDPFRDSADLLCVSDGSTAEFLDN